MEQRSTTDLPKLSGSNREAHPLRCKLDGGLKEAPIVGAPPEASRNPANLHRHGFPYVRSRAARSQCPSSAAAAYVLSMNSSSISRGEAAARTASYGSRNSDNSRLRNASD